jgi:diguanylate cyclase (GGDEF)-like protein
VKDNIKPEILDFILDRIDVGVFIVDTKLVVQSWNQFMSAHSGKSAADVIGKTLPELFPELSVRWFQKKIDSVVILKNRAFTSWRQRPYLFAFNHNRPVTGGVEYMYQNCTLIPIKNSSGEVTSVCITIQDATDEGMSHLILQQTMSRLEVSSRTDGLTMLANRMHWESCLLQECKRASRYGAITSLIMFDLDHFKNINDTYGHLAGDEVLRAVAAILQQTIRETDIAGRYGGEEFAVIATDTPVDRAMLLAERIRAAIEGLNVIYDDQRIPVTVSLGVAGYTAEMDSHEALISCADDALYKAKHNGRNCCMQAN